MACTPDSALKQSLNSPEAMTARMTSLKQRIPQNQAQTPRRYIQTGMSMAPSESPAQVSGRLAAPKALSQDLSKMTSSLHGIKGKLSHIE